VCTLDGHLHSVTYTRINCISTTSGICHTM